MRGLMFYDANLKGQCYCCNICGRQITGFKAWMYREGDIILFFCGDTQRCRDEFLELNSLHDVREKERMSEPSLIEITNDKEFMDRVLKKSAKMQEETLKEAEEEE